MTQAIFPDVHRYYRTGGIDWDKFEANALDCVIIGAAVGMTPNPILREQIDGAIIHGVPFMTYMIPSPNFSMSAQVEHYLSLYCVKDAWTCGDLEPPGGGVRCVNGVEAFSFVRSLEDRTQRKPLIYSNPKYINEDLKHPAWLPEYKLWLAQWLYKFWPFFYTDFESFLLKYAGKKPPYVRNTVYEQNTIAWQYTYKGNAQKFLASKYTNDPKYPFGINDADFNVSCIEEDSFLDLMTGEDEPPTPPPVVPGDWYRIGVSDRNIRNTPNSITGTVLITLHQNDQVKISEIVSGVPGQWGRVVAYLDQGQEKKFFGYIYMNNLFKV